jgi:hypothetical protein
MGIRPILGKQHLTSPLFHFLPFFTFERTSASQPTIVGMPDSLRGRCVRVVVVGRRRNRWRHQLLRGRRGRRCVASVIHRWRCDGVCSRLARVPSRHRDGVLLSARPIGKHGAVFRSASDGISRCHSPCTNHIRVRSSGGDCRRIVVPMVPAADCRNLHSNGVPGHWAGRWCCGWKSGPVTT